MRLLWLLLSCFLLFSCLSDDTSYQKPFSDFVSWAVSDSLDLPAPYTYMSLAREMEEAAPGGAFFAAAVLEDKGHRDGALIAYSYAAEKSELATARYFALEAIVDIAREKGDFSIVDKYIRENMLISGEFSFYASALFEAWARTGGGNRKFLDSFLSRRYDSSSYVWAAIARAALEDSYDKKLAYYIDVLFTVSSDNIPADFWLFFKPFSLPETSAYGLLSRAVYYSKMENYTLAVSYYKRYASTAPMFSPVILYDFYRAYRLYGRLSEGAEYFYKLSSSVSDYSYELLDYAARLYRFSGAPRASTAVWQDILDYQLSLLPDKRDTAVIERAAWYLFANAIRISDDAVFDVLSYLTEKNVLYSASGGGLFSTDIFAPELDDFISVFIREKKWYSLVRLYSELEFSLSPRHAALLSSVILQAAGADFMDLSDSFAKKLREVLKKAASDSHVHPYYFLLAYPNRNPLDYYTGLRTDNEAYTDPDADAFLKTALSFSFLPDFILWVDRLYKRVSPDVLYSAAKKLSLSGNYLEAIRLLSDIHDEGTRLSLPVVKELMYPMPYVSIASEEAEKRSVPLFLVYGLMREESLFTPSINSHAGAMGLMQLMPDTAEEERKKIGLSPGNLNAPGYNIAIGTSYLARLIERFKLPMYALAAYNAGPSRLNLWMSSYKDLPPLLWLEALPIRETRHYLRKVLSSSIYYASIYKGRHTRDTLFMLTGTDVVLALHTQGE
ncbi:lytic transglycosylase domain-containing protein [Spirochaetia bacterium 38H-sp]|uniref:Lytic transglycosylase domain-containing protein n=1 Tax=Rarispira pelagica TaxID=3141764 RepID=A0ABU9UCJ2_9SPIR